MKLYIFKHLAIPLEMWDELDHKITQGLKFDGFRRGKFIRNQFRLDNYAQYLYYRSKDVIMDKSLSIVPYEFRYKEIINLEYYIKIYVRYLGFITLEINKDLKFDSLNIEQIKTEIEKMKKILSRISSQNIAKTLFPNNNYYFSKEKYLLVGFTDNINKIDPKQIRPLFDYTANFYVKTEKASNNLKMFAKSLIVAFFTQPNSGQRGRKTIRRSLIHSLSLGYGMHEFLKTETALSTNISHDTWFKLIHSFNPLNLSELYIYDGFLHSSLKRSWFNRVSMMFKLRKSYRAYLHSLLTNSDKDHVAILTFSNIIAFLPRTSFEIFSISINKFFSLSMKENKVIEAIHRLGKHQRAEINKNFSGFTRNKIFLEMGVTANKKAYNDWEPIFYQLKLRGLIHEVDYHGPGKTKTALVLDREVFLLRSKVSELINVKFPPEIDF